MTKKVISLATIKFFDDSSIEVGLSSPNGVTARKLDTVTSLLYKKLNEARAIERRKTSGSALEAGLPKSQAITVPDETLTESNNA